MLFVILYIELIAYPAAFDIDKQTGCHFDANWPMCKAHDIELYSLAFYCGAFFLDVICIVVAILEFLYLRFIKKELTNKTYKTVFVVLFWVGIAIYPAFILLFFILILFHS